MAKTKLALHWQILIGLVLGVVTGLAINLLWTDSVWSSMGVNDATVFVSMAKPTADTPPDAVHVPNADASVLAHAARFVRNANAFVGDLFLRLLKFIAVPIVLFSLVAGVASLNDSSKLGRIGGKTIAIYLITTAAAIAVGLMFVNAVGPGKGFPEDLRETLQSQQADVANQKISDAGNRPTPWQVALDLVPENPFEALARAEMLQVVFAALAIGVALTLLPKAMSDPVVALFDAMTHVVIKIVEIILRLAPYAVFCLLVKVVADLGFDVLQALAWYALTVVLGLAVMIFGVYPLVLRLFTHIGYGRFFWAISPAQLLAFSSSSSGATLPVTLDVCEKRLGVKDEVTSFVIPVGSTVNMDGTALYQGMAAMFIAQIYGIETTLSDQLTIVLTATLASIGTAAVPGVGIVMLVIVLSTLGWPMEGIAVILGIDRILDMCRTTCNVTGDCMVCAVVGASEGALLPADEVDRRLALEEQAGFDEHPANT